MVDTCFLTRNNKIGQGINICLIVGSSGTIDKPRISEVYNILATALGTFTRLLKYILRFQNCKTSSVTAYRRKTFSSMSFSIGCILQFYHGDIIYLFPVLFAFGFLGRLVFDVAKVVNFVNFELCTTFKKEVKIQIQNVIFLFPLVPLAKISLKSVCVKVLIFFVIFYIFCM